ncbi:exosporium protein C [Cohnella sp. JJ-181]|uniref:exosporium protein C n=1 Tax=Cohnella rhizoplanae TaxID=2974897 RepID=UPI0022FFA08F|nr:exosporium protein C [Cohnella sp. JJ-181]CAI6059728.1 hypothetical protein COHCIP112018_01825 [Cohnella sp. JJ-181]
MAIVHFNATSVTPITDGVQIPVPQTPQGVGLATVISSVPSIPNTVQLSASVGLRGDVGTGSVLFRIFRDGHEIYYSRQGIESGFEQFALVTLQAYDNAAPGQHAYTLSIEKLTAGLTATVIGPINLSATVYSLT